MQLDRLSAAYLNGSGLATPLLVATSTARGTPSVTQRSHRIAINHSSHRNRQQLPLWLSRILSGAQRIPENLPKTIAKSIANSRINLMNVWMEKGFRRISWRILTIIRLWNRILRKSKNLEGNLLYTINRFFPSHVLHRRDQMKKRILKYHKKKSLPRNLRS